MAFEGDTKEYRALTDEIIDGPLVGRWALDEEGTRALVSHGIIERFAEMIRPFISKEENGIDDKMRRSTLMSYPGKR